MKKKLKLLLFLVLAGAIAVLLILGTWLYGSYNQRMQLFLATAEHSLFEAIQETIQQANKGKNLVDLAVPHGPTARLTKQVVDKVVEKFPNVPREYLNNLFDSVYRKEVRAVASVSATRSNRLSRLTADGVRPEMLSDKRVQRGIVLPLFNSVGNSTDEEVLQQIKTKFREYLIAKGIDIKYEFKLVTLPEHDFRKIATTSSPQQLNPGVNDIRTGTFSIRPVMVDPNKGKFITVEFSNPWQFLFYSMSWQLMISLVLVGTIIGSFVYLFYTLLKQNKLDILRKAFVNNLTHELRTPVTTVSVALQALEGAVGNVHDRASYYGIANEELNRLSSMIDKVLQISEDDVLVDKQLVVKEYDMITLIHKCIASAQLSTMQGNVHFVFSPSRESELLIGDPHHMRNVIGNLMENAVKYGASEVKVALEMKKDGRYIALSIQDNGIGIPSAYHAQVFEPFFRVPQGDLYSVKGFGVGLAYVQQIIKQHGGYIALKSEPGHGSTFILTIPKNMKR